MLLAFGLCSTVAPLLLTLIHFVYQSTHSFINIRLHTVSFLEDYTKVCLHRLHTQSQTNGHKCADSELIPPADQNQQSHIYFISNVKTSACMSGENETWLRGGVNKMYVRKQILSELTVCFSFTAIFPDRPPEAGFCRCCLHTGVF